MQTVKSSQFYKFILLVTMVAPSIVVLLSFQYYAKEFYKAATVHTQTEQGAGQSKAAAGFSVRMNKRADGTIHALITPFSLTRSLTWTWILPSGEKVHASLSESPDFVLAGESFTATLRQPLKSSLQSGQRQMRVAIQISGKVDGRNVGTADVLDLDRIDKNGDQAIEPGVAETQAAIVRSVKRTGKATQDVAYFQ